MLFDWRVPDADRLLSRLQGGRQRGKGSRESVAGAVGASLCSFADHDLTQTSKWCCQRMAAKRNMVWEKTEVSRLASLLMILHHSAHLIGLSGRRDRVWGCGKQLWSEEREAEKDAGFVCSSPEPELKKYCEVKRGCRERKLQHWIHFCTPC